MLNDFQNILSNENLNINMMNFSFSVYLNIFKNNKNRIKE